MAAQRSIILCSGFSQPPQLSYRLWRLPPQVLPVAHTRLALSSFVVRAARQKLWKNRPAEGPQVAVKRVVEALQVEGANVQEVLRKKGAFIKPTDWFAVLDEVGKQRRWLLALEIFRWLQLQSWYKPDNGYYSKMISIMGREKQLRLATWLFAEMKRKGLRPNTSMYNALIAAQVAMTDIPGSLDKALCLLEKMKEKKASQPSIVTYNTLIRAFALAGDVEKVTSLFNELEEAKLGPDLYTFNGILGAYGKQGHVQRMEEMYELMKVKKCKPDAVTLNSLISAYGKAGEFDKAEQLLDRMMKSKQAPATVKTFNSLIHAYGQAGQLQKMEEVAEKLMDAGHDPTPITFEVMIAAYARAGAVDSMGECLEAMRVAQLRPSLATCKLMLEVLCNNNLFHRAEEFLDDAMLSGFKAEETLYNVILKAYAVGNRTVDIERVLNKMEQDGVRFDRAVQLDLLYTYAKGRSRSSIPHEAEGDLLESNEDNPDHQ